MEYKQKYEQEQKPQYYVMKSRKSWEGRSHVRDTRNLLEGIHMSATLIHGDGLIGVCKSPNSSYCVH